MAKMSFEKYTYNPSYNLWGLPSVIMGKREGKFLESNYSESCRNIQTNHALYKTLHRLVANKPDWKFEIGDLVQIRKNRSWYADEFAMIIEDKGVQSHVEGGRVYTIQFLGKTDTAQLEERDLKIMRQSAVDKKAKEKDNNV